jgi:hypothetical protein
MDIIAAASQFINSTSSHIFLTGKAGTGKTTFLRNLASCTHKQFAIVAPTGIAALNAGGVTIHSQFLLPFGMFIPERIQLQHEGNFYTSDTLARKHSLNSVRKQVLRSIELLVIDEVSMLRADLLDAIDYRMKSARGNFAQSFGGVQLLLIGDLYQLPPVVKRDEENQLKRYYNSAWFFESRALKQSGFVYIELDKIFRQHDDRFISLLNNLRNNNPTKEDIAELNKYYRSPEEIQNMQEVITLTTHNYKADELNARALKELKTPSHILRASIEGEFPPHIFPVLEHLEIKEGAQIMFTKNDTENKIYFNGKLATVKSIRHGEVTVEMAGDHLEYTLKKEVWQNKRYTLNDSTHDLDDEVIGTFEQYPVKLAWAITIHKSQGLTFEKAIIDVGEAFADGQVYVALSRLRSIEGLVMRTRIDPDVISTDKQIVLFTKNNNVPEALPEVMKGKQREYIRHLIATTFDFENIGKEMAYVRRYHQEEKGFEEVSMKSILEQISNSIAAEKLNTERFRRQLMLLLDENNQAQLLERIKKGTEYYKNFLWTQVEILLRHIEEMRSKKKVKTYLNNLADIDQLFAKKLEEVDKSQYLAESILSARYEFDFSKLAEARADQRSKLMEEIRSKVKPPAVKKKKGKRGKKDELSTYDITLNLLESGMTIEAVAKERGLAIGTIESHLAHAVGANRLSIFKFMREEDVETISTAIKEMSEGFTSKDLHIKLDGKYGYGILRAVINHCQIVELYASGE